MLYFKSLDGGVFAYETQQERDQFGGSDLAAMTQLELDAHLAPDAQPPQVPSIVTMRQARLALHASGLLAGVEAAIEALQDPPKTEARIEWDFSSEVHRNKPFVEMLTVALGLTEQEVDDLFTLAETL